MDKIIKIEITSEIIDSITKTDKLRIDNKIIATQIIEISSSNKGIIIKEWWIIITGEIWIKDSIKIIWIAEIDLNKMDRM